LKPHPTSTTCTFDSPVTNQEAHPRLFRATLDSTGNLPSLPAVPGAQIL